MSSTAATHPTRTVEQYLEWIYYLYAEGEEVIGARLAERLGVRPPTVHAALRRMVRDGWVTLDERKRIHLSARGLAVAEAIIRRHRLAERFLTDVLGMEWSRAHEEAGRLEHAISGELGERLSRFLGDPATCPHGNPIPGNWRGPGEPTFRLSEMGEGTEIIVRRITEDAEQDPEVLHFLEQSGLGPGERWTIARVLPEQGLLSLERDGQQVSLPLTVARWLRAIAAPEEPA